MYSDPTHRLLDEVARELVRCVNQLDRIADALDVRNQLALQEAERRTRAGKHEFRPIGGTSSICTCGLRKHAEVHDLDVVDPVYALTRDVTEADDAQR